MKRVKLLLVIALLISFYITESNAQGISRFWGMSSKGGSHDLGVIFSLDAESGVLKNRFSFATLIPGANPTGELLETDGKLYGTVSAGGKEDKGLIFSWNPVSGDYEVLLDFADVNAKRPTGYLAAEGTTLYGMTHEGGVNGGGILFSWNPEEGFVKLHDFAMESGWLPNGGIVFHHNKLYGLTSEGGPGNEDTGVIFEYDLTSATYSVKQGLTNATGRSPMGGLTFYNNRFYGLTSYGGDHGSGSLFEWAPAEDNPFTVLFHFDPAETGTHPQGSLVVRNNELYGTTQAGGDNNEGTIFRFKPDGAVFTHLFDFTGVTGSYPIGNLYFSDEKFYGVTSAGGDHELGVVFEIDTDGNYQVLYHLTTQNGASPKGGFTMVNKVLYGLTFRGGANDRGTIFSWNPATETYQKKLDFSLNNGAEPVGNLISYNGKLYGMTSMGGAENGGILFEFDPADGTFTRHLDFIAEKGFRPMGSLTLVDGIFYGMTNQGGENNDGVIFEWNPAMPGTYTKKADLNNETGNYSKNSLVLADGKLYGMTYAGGQYNKGVIFEWLPGGDETDFRLIYSFPSGSGEINPKGNTPLGEFTLLGDYLYGMTSAGGDFMGGTIFRWKPGDAEPEFLYSFSNTTSGAEPLGNLTEKEGMLYGMTSKGGVNHSGTLFSFNPVNSDFQKIVDFGENTGNAPQGSLILNNNKFYGMTYAGGTDVGGTVFEWDPGKQEDPDKGISIITDLAPEARYPIGDLTVIPAPVAPGTQGSCIELEEIIIDENNNTSWVPVKDENGNAVAEINANGNNLGAVQVSFYVHDEDAVREDGTHKLYLNRNITITPENPTLAEGTQVGLRLYILKSEFDALAEAVNSDDEPSGITEIADLALFKSSTNTCAETLSGQAEKITSDAVKWEDDYVITASIAGFSTFYFASNTESTLPVNLVNFTAKALENRIYLEWKTTDEVNFSHFELERSLDGRNFKSILTVPSHHQGYYTAMDEETLWADYAYYRLKMIDRDHSYHHSSIISVELPSRQYLTIYPNPVISELVLKPNNAAPRPSHWEIITADGMAIHTGQWNDVQEKINVTSLPPGVYILGLYSDSVFQRLRFVKE